MRLSALSSGILEITTRSTISRTNITTMQTSKSLAISAMVDMESMTMCGVGG
jgi:hypothetical protein